MKQVLVALLVAAVCIVGCERPPEPPPEPVKAPPTAAEIETEIRGAMPAWEQFPIGPYRPIPPDVEEKFKSALRSGQSKHRTTENGKKALASMEAQLNQRLDGFVENKKWTSAKLVCEGLLILTPDNGKASRTLDRAVTEINRPRLKVLGFFSKEGRTYAFLEIFLPETNQTVKEQHQEGDEFYNMKFQEIIGNQKGIIAQYLINGEIYEIPYNGGR